MYLFGDLDDEADSQWTEKHRKGNQWFEEIEQRWIENENLRNC